VDLDAVAVEFHLAQPSPPGTSLARIGLHEAERRHTVSPPGWATPGVRVDDRPPGCCKHIERVNERLHRRINMHISILDAPAHLEGVNEAVVQHVVDVAWQALNGRAADIFDALSVEYQLTFSWLLYCMLRWG